jgi:threonine efflux protein
MTGSSLITANLVLAYTAYAVGTASPGPSNLAVMATAMTHGRRAGLIFALGVVSGSMAWGVLAALGLSTTLTAQAQVLGAVKVLGGIYLLWLAVKSAKGAVASDDPAVRSLPGAHNSGIDLFLRGAAMHLTNPKALLVWLSFMALAIPHDARRDIAWLIVIGAVPIGAAVFCGYAIAFSTDRARAIYMRMRPGFDAALALVFGYAGLHMLLFKAA